VVVDAGDSKHASDTLARDQVSGTPREARRKNDYLFHGTTYTCVRTSLCSGLRCIALRFKCLREQTFWCPGRE